MRKLGWVERRDKMEKVFPKLLGACKQILDRLDFHGSIDTVREEGPIEDLRQVIEEAGVIK